MATRLRSCFLHRTGSSEERSGHDGTGARVLRALVEGFRQLTRAQGTAKAHFGAKERNARRGGQFKQ